MADARIQEITDLLPQALLHDWVRLGSRLVRLLRDQHHAETHEAILNRLLAQARASVALRAERRLHVPCVSYPPDLPITARKDDIVAAIRGNQVVVIAGETGSGKTTQIPKMCLDAGLGIEAMIGCTQPRRVAALSISRRIAEELNANWGREVGCKIRFDDRSSAQTYIKLMTDGILLAETQGDPLLSEYNALIIDEAHERSLNIDFLLGYLKGLLAKRTDLKLIITSATIDTEAFARHFGGAPIIEVSGRLFPVEVRYAPEGDWSAPEPVASNLLSHMQQKVAPAEAWADVDFIESAVRATEQVLCEPGSGDVLIFMPGERDIRETSDMLEGRFGQEAEIIPLFGRLSAGDQQRVFAPASRRKIVIATNIAETSLTIPGIRYVIDTGLARMSRYNPRTRTKRLPVEEISQSSANQRKGRSGRVQDGVCVRLYSEEDFTARPLYTQPEIQRANLAEVILRMRAFRLGEIETFPFVNPPPPAAIQGGYALLQELGALDEARALMPLGRDLARLPIDPTLGRMLLQSQHEHATRELLIIAAGLSIQDPRDRPLDQKDAAAAAHKRFVDPQSDFLTLLNIWNAVHDQWETLRTQGQRRKFCKAHFLSYLRMREWQDLHAQLHGALEDLGTVRLNESNAAYDAIHRSILTGLLGHVATRNERNLYKAAGNRQVTIFPGSALHAKFAPLPKKAAPSKGKPAPKPAAPPQPEWLMAGEIVETSQLFARTVAGIDPLWIIQLAPHLCKVTHQNPHWSAAAGRVLVDEKATLYGLEIRNHKVAYGNINPKEATEIFIRSALVEEDLLPSRGSRRGDEADSEDDDLRLLMSAATRQPELPPRYRFIEHNRQIRQKIETWQTRVRRHEFGDLDEAMCSFYAKHIENVSSVHELNRLLGSQADSSFLCLTETDLTGGRELSYDAEAFPDSVPLDGQPVPLSYAYTPGEEHDGVTVKLGFTLAQTVSPASVEWAVPGLRESQIAELLRALPKTLRRPLMPLPPKVIEIARDLRPSGESLQHDLARFLRQRYGVEVPPTAWPAGALPAHLRPRVEIVGNDQKPLGASRDLDQLRKHLEKTKVEPAQDDAAWLRAAQQWERVGLTSWSFGDLPERVTVSETGPLPLYAWPGLAEEEHAVSLKLFRSQEAARRASLRGVQRLVELAVQKDLGWLQKDLRALAEFEPLLAGLGSMEELQSAAFTNLRRHLLPTEPLPALARAHFDAAETTARNRLPGLVVKLSDRLSVVLKLRHEILRRAGVAPASSRQSAFLRPGRGGLQTREMADWKSALPSLGAALPPAAWPLARPPGTLSPSEGGRGRLPDSFAQSNRAGGSGSSSLLATELAGLLPPNFLEVIPFERLPHLPRYLKAVLIRSERAALNPAKDADRARQLAPYVETLRQLQDRTSTSTDARQQLDEFRWLIEEFKVSLFAQELGTAMPISPKRLDAYLEGLRRSV